jgi:mannose/fructose-specific phosphotransferase system component IIA
MLPDMPREVAVAIARMLIADLPCPGCLVLVDVGGGASPFVVACRLRDELGAKLRVVSGLNTAMLVTALGHPQLDVDALAAHVARRAGDGTAAYPPLEGK